MRNIIIASLTGSGLILTGCGTSDKLERSSRKKSTKESGSEVSSVEADDEVEQNLVQDEVPSDATPTPEPEQEEGAKPKPRKPLPGWLDASTGYRFVLLEGEAPFAIADLETEDFALYLDMTPDQRKDTKAAKQKSEDGAVDLVMTFFPEIGIYLSLAQGIVSQLEAMGAAYDKPDRRQSLCERKLGRGWHYPSENLVKNADEDEIRKHVENLEGAKVWLASRGIPERHYYEFTKDAPLGKEVWVWDDPSLKSLCTTKAQGDDTP